MNKLKISPGLAGIILLTSLFVGWQTLLLAVLLMLLFCEVDDKIKSLIIKVVSFFAAYTIVVTAWDLIVSGVDVVTGTIVKILNLFSELLDDPIDYSNFSKYFLSPISSVVKIADGVLSYLFILIKFGFILSTIQNKPMKDNAVSKKINEFVNKVVNYINGLEFGNVVNPTPSPVAPAPAPAPSHVGPAPAPMNNQMPKPAANPTGPGNNNPTA